MRSFRYRRYTLFYWVRRPSTWEESARCRMVEYILSTRASYILKYFQRSFFKLLDHHNVQDYEVFEIRILNRILIKEMLGDDVWKTTQNEMIKILSQHEPNEIVFQFADDDLENIYSIMIRQQKTEEDPVFLKKLKEITTLRLEVEYKIVPIPPEEMS